MSLPTLTFLLLRIWPSIHYGFLAFPRLISTLLPPLYCPWITRFTRQGQQIHPGSSLLSVVRANKATEEVSSLSSHWWLPPGSASPLPHPCSLSLPHLACSFLFSTHFLFLFPSSSFLVFLSFDLLLPFNIFSISLYSPSSLMSVFLLNW